MMDVTQQVQQENALNLLLDLGESRDRAEGQGPEETRLARQEAAREGKVAEQELFKFWNRDARR